ncbi:MAG: mannosyltransferase [Winogradskyella sp.]|nr:MAG: mannosyltransferase [Winogradskyella sp.]
MLLNPSLFKFHKAPLLCILVSLILYASFAYDLARTEAAKLVLLYTALFICAYFLKKSAGFNFSLLVIASILMRLVFLPAIPNLSQDFYRFTWDGRMLFEGFNPYLYTPDSFIQNSEFPVEQAKELYNGMGTLNASHFTNYPPINQFCFYIAALFSGKSITGAIVSLRVLIIAADIGTLYFGKKLLEALKLPSSRIWWYMLNPFIIIELTGNLHFEGVMIFFLVWSLYLLQTNRWKLAAVIFACSISVKLIPLMFLPIFFGWFWKRKKDASASLRMTNLVLFYVIVIGSTMALFLPFFSMKFIDNYAQTVGLWFNNFEFNASIYYLAREIGYAITGYNEIKTIGKILPVVALLIILYFSFFRKNITIPKLTSSILIAFTYYLFLSTTVHPWYLATLVILCLFTNYRFPLIWSVAIILSYLAYISIGNADKSENLWIIALEYTIVFSAFIWEVLLRRKIRI